MLRSAQRIREIQQGLMLQATVDHISHGLEEEISIDDALQWTAHEYASVHYEVTSCMGIQVHPISGAGKWHGRAPGCKKANKNDEVAIDIVIIL